MSDNIDAVEMDPDPFAYEDYGDVVNVLDPMVETLFRLQYDPGSPSNAAIDAFATYVNPTDPEFTEMKAFLQTISPFCNDRALRIYKLDIAHMADGLVTKWAVREITKETNHASVQLGQLETIDFDQIRPVFSPYPLHLDPTIELINFRTALITDHALIITSRIASLQALIPSRMD